MSTPKKTFVSSSTSETTELGWKLKRVTETHDMRQRKLMEEYREKSRALSDECQVEQSAVFDELRTAMGISDTDWGDGGRSWALNIEDLVDGTVALVHETDPSRLQADDCDCPICQLRRAMGGQIAEDEDEQPPMVH